MRDLRVVTGHMRLMGQTTHSEPPLIERARRVGWALIVASVMAMVLARVGPLDWRWVNGIFAVATGLFGLLAIVNVALIRRIYRVLDDSKSNSESLREK